MLYLAIDQHRKQLTVNLSKEQGDVILKRQVSTEWPRMRTFLAEVQRRALLEGGFVAILEVCGFNDWLLKLLAEYGCRQTILIQPEKQSRQNTRCQVQSDLDDCRKGRRIHEGMCWGAAAMKRTARQPRKRRP